MSSQQPEPPIWVEETGPEVTTIGRGIDVQLDGQTVSGCTLPP